MGKAFVVLTGVMVLGVGSAWAIKSGLGRVAEEIQQSPGFAAGWAREDRGVRLHLPRRRWARPAWPPSR